MERVSKKQGYSEDTLPRTETSKQLCNTSQDVPLQRALGHPKYSWENS